jgi:O-antigen/teichoic acid export membrane protein
VIPPGRILTNLIALLAGEGLGRAFSLATTIYLARTLGVAQFGLVETAFAVLVYLQIVADGGLDIVATRAVARAPERRPVFAANLLAIRGTLVAAALAAVVVLNAATVRPASLEDMLLRMSAAVVPLAASVAWAFQSSQRMRAMAAGQVITQASFFGLALLFVRGPADGLMVPLVYAAAVTIGTAAMVWWYVRRHGWTRPTLDLGFWREVLPQSAPIAASRVLRAVSFNFDVLLLGYFYSEVLVGLYAAAYRFVTLPMLLYVHAFTAMFPSLVHLTPAERTRTFGRIVTMAAATGFAIAVAVYLAAEPMLRLVMGEPFLGGAAPLRVLAWSIPVAAVAGVLRQALLTADCQRADFAVVAVAAVANAGLNIMLIPRAGLVGAATATLLGETVMLLAAFVAVVQTRALGRPMRRFARDAEDVEP